MEILTNKPACAKIQKDADVPADSFLVTDIRAALKNENRVNVFLNGKYDFSLDISQVVDLGIKVGKNYPLSEIEHFRNASEYGKLYQRTLEWILMRPRSVYETYDHLKKRQIKRDLDNKHRASLKEYKKSHKDENPYKNPDNLDERGRLKFKNSPWAQNTNELSQISDANIEAVVHKLIEKGYLDDRKFAKFYLENRYVKKGISTRRLREELKKKGISKENIDLAMAEMPRDDTEEIKKIIMRKRKKYDDYKLINYLVRQGFDYQLVQNLVHETD